LSALSRSSIARLICPIRASMVDSDAPFSARCVANVLPKVMQTRIAAKRKPLRSDLVAEEAPEFRSSPCSGADRHDSVTPSD